MALNNFIKLFCCDIFVCVDAALLNCSDQGPHSAFLPFDVRVEPEGWGTGGLWEVAQWRTADSLG